jgi:hypothetical protein
MLKVTPSAAPICRDQYPESDWWKQVPEVMAAIGRHDNLKASKR